MPSLTVAPQLPELPELPALCGPAGAPVTRDLNIDWECKRSHQLCNLHSVDEEIRREWVRAEKLDATGKTWRASNLRKWCVEAAARHARITALVLERYPTCTHGARG